MLRLDGCQFLCSDLLQIVWNNRIKFSSQWTPDASIEILRDKSTWYKHESNPSSTFMKGFLNAGSIHWWAICHLSFGHTSADRLVVGHVLKQGCLKAWSSSGSGGLCPNIILQLKSSKLGSIVKGILPTIFKHYCHILMCSKPTKQIAGATHFTGCRMVFKEMQCPPQRYILQKVEGHTLAQLWRSIVWASCMSLHRVLCNHLFRDSDISLFEHHSSVSCLLRPPPLPA
jgi:hypothetical protein